MDRAWSDLSRGQNSIWEELEQALKSRTIPATADPACGDSRRGWQAAPVGDSCGQGPHRANGTKLGQRPDPSSASPRTPVTVFARGRGCKETLRKVDELIKEGNAHVVDADLDSYFYKHPVWSR